MCVRVYGRGCTREYTECMSARCQLGRTLRCHPERARRTPPTAPRPPRSPCAHNQTSLPCRHRHSWRPASRRAAPRTPSAPYGCGAATDWMWQRGMKCAPAPSPCRLNGGRSGGQGGSQFKQEARFVGQHMGCITAAGRATCPGRGEATGVYGSAPGNTAAPGSAAATTTTTATIAGGRGWGRLVAAGVQGLQRTAKGRVPVTATP